MTTPPSNQPPPPPIESGPAWLRNPKTSPKKHKSRTPYSANAATAAASSSSSISLLNPQASTSSLTLAQPHQITEPPYLAHKHRYHGQLTLVAPDNSARARQAGTVDPPEMRIDARGGFGLPGMDEEEAAEDEEGEAGGGGQARKIRKKVKKKKKKEEEQQRQRQIMQAVSNAGRTPSPSSNAPVSGQAVGATPGGPNEMARSSSGQAMLTVPSGNEPRERRSRSRSRNRRTEERTTTSATPARSPQNLTNCRPTPSTQTTPSDPAPSSRRPRTSRPVPPVPTPSQPVTTHRRSLSPDYMPPPAHESLESQVSLGLLDPSILLSPPPPAYDPPPPISHPLDPPPPISAPSLHQTRRTLSASASTVDSEEDEESDNDGGIADPLVMAWEEDRLTGLYSLDERIARDMERRRLASEAILSTQGDSPNPVSPEVMPEGEEEEVPGQEKDDLNEIRQAEASRDNRRLSRALSRHASRRYAAGSRRSTLLMGSSSSGLGSLRESREGAESTSPVPQVTSLSPSPSELPTLIEPTPTSSQPPRPSPDPETFHGLVLPPLMSAAESSAIAAEFPSPSPSQASPSLSNSPYISDTEDESIPPLPASPLAKQTNEEQAETESEDEEEEETKEQELARKVTRSGREMAVLAAERRARMEREERERRERGLAVEPVVEEEEDEKATKDDKAQEEEGQIAQIETKSLEIGQAPTTTQSRLDHVRTSGSQVTTSVQSPSTIAQPSIPARRRDPTPPDSELSFSQPSSRSSYPRPAAPPQLVPIEPETTTTTSYVPIPLARSHPPPVPPRRSIGRRSLDEPLPIGVTSTPPLTLHRNTSGRCAPPPPPPPREVAHRSSVRSIAAALNGTQSTPSPPRTNLPPPSSPPVRSTATLSNSTRRESLDSGSVGSASTYPSTLTGPRPVPTSLPGPSVTIQQPLSSSAPVSSSLSPDIPAQSTSTAPRRHRPLPIPPQPLSQDRIDAFTALRAVQGVLSPTESNLVAVPAPPIEPVPSPAASTSTSRPILRPRVSSSLSSSSLENPGPPLPRRPPQATRPEEQLSAYTDLDLLLARLEGEAANSDEETPRVTEEGATAGGGGEGEDGRNYDDLLTLGEIMGNVAPAGASPEELAEHLTVARVELERRRIDKRGKVKTKLSVVGVRCVDCSICMSRFKVDDSAVVLSNCLHIFHEKCIRSWFQRSRVCPVCRAQVFPDRPLVDLTSP